ncbi:MAG: fibronectin type III domain-containing protein, partial [Vicinamibacteraceae bacterium]
MQLLRTLSVLAVVCMAAACSEDSPTAPAEVAPPGGGGSRTEERGEEGPTLKLTPPMPMEPADGHRYDKDERAKPLEAEAAAGEFAEIEGVVHRFQVFKGGRRVVNRVVSGGGETVRLDMKGTGLSAKTTYQWRVRGENEEGVGPWSPTFSFTTGASS